MLDKGQDTLAYQSLVLRQEQRMLILIQAVHLGIGSTVNDSIRKIYDVIVNRQLGWMPPRPSPLRERTLTFVRKSALFSMESVVGSGENSRAEQLCVSFRETSAENLVSGSFK